MLHVIKFALDKKNYCLKIQPNFDDKNYWKWKVFSDCDWVCESGNEDQCDGFHCLLAKHPCLLAFKGARGITLTSSKDDYAALSDAVKEIRFMHFILRHIGNEDKIPIITDNEGKKIILLVHHLHSRIF
jgi:hypothetical protein